MKTINLLLKSCVLGALLAIQSHAANVSVETLVTSKNMWVKVVPSLRGQLRGSVTFLPKFGGWVTDSVAPGEEIRWSMTAEVSKERLLKSGACLDSFLAQMERVLIVIPGAKLPAVGVTRVPTQAFNGPVLGQDFDVLVITDRVRSLVKFPIVNRPR